MCAFPTPSTAPSAMAIWSVGGSTCIVTRDSLLSTGVIRPNTPVDRSFISLGWYI